MFADNRDAFMAQLVAEISAFRRKAARAGLTPCVRLNGTSDIVWESVGLCSEFDALKRYTLFDRFPSLQFYDYTKLPGRLARTMPANYHLSISWSGADASYQRKAEQAAREYGAPLVVVRHGRYPLAYTEALQGISNRAACAHIVNGDESDLRFIDPLRSLVVLRSKGLARRDASGFVLAN
jgi:hypothetical protein